MSEEWILKGDKLKREILDRIEYQGKKLDGSVEFSNSFDGDILSMVYRLLNEPTDQLTTLTEERDRLREESLKFYKADGSFEILDSPEAVTTKRKECATYIKKLVDALYEAQRVLDLHAECDAVDMIEAALTPQESDNE